MSLDFTAKDEYLSRRNATLGIDESHPAARMGADWISAKASALQTQLTSRFAPKLTPAEIEANLEKREQLLAVLPLVEAYEKEHGVSPEAVIVYDYDPDEDYLLPYWARN